MRRFGDSVRADISYTDRPGAYAVIRDGLDLLVTEQLGEEAELQLPGGGIDPGENTVMALHRECYEETGWKISIERRLGAYQRYTYMPEYDLWARKVCHIYLARPTLRIGPPTEPGHTAVWMPMTSAAQLLTNTGDRHYVSILRN